MAAVAGDPWVAPFVRMVGSDLRAEIESHSDPSRIDHLWITMNIGGPRRAMVSVNTLSRHSREAGFDPRVRVGVLRSPWTVHPPRGITEWDGLDYETLTAEANVYFEAMEKSAVEQALLEACRSADLLEAFGEPYRRRGLPGVHQVHSRRASHAVPKDLHHRDGALRFYFPNGTAKWFLLKFAGQP